LARLFKWIVEDMKLHETLKPWMLGSSSTADTAITCLGESANNARGKPCQDCPLAIVPDGASRQWRAPWFLPSGTLAKSVNPAGKLRILYWDPSATTGNQYAYYWDFAKSLLDLHDACLLNGGSVSESPGVGNVWKE